MERQSGRTYLYIMVYNGLKEGISQGKYPPGALLPSESEIGQIYEVDRTTVRKALQLLVEEGLVVKRAGKGSVVTDGQGRPVDEAEPVRRGDTHGTIGFLLPKSDRNGDRITQPFYASLFYTIEQQCSAQGYQLIYSTVETEADYDNLLDSQRYSAVVFVSNVSPRIMDSAVERGLPCVLVNSWYGGIPSILSDNFQGTFDACNHLIARGHREIGVIKGIDAYATTQERFNGCLAALARAGLTLRAEYTLQAEWDYESGSRAMAELLDSGVKLPTALVAFNDHLALGAIHALGEAGLRVPEDISVVGFDNLDQVRYLSPGLTTVDINPAMMGQVAMHRLWEQMHSGKSLPVKILTPVSLVVRGSVGVPASGSMS